MVDDEHESFKDTGVGIGANAEGKVEVFPLAELPARLAAINEQERAWDDAMRDPEEVEAEEDVGDLSDLDDLDEVLG